MDQPRAKRKSSAGVADAVRLLQKCRKKKPQVQEEEKNSSSICAVCNGTEDVTVECSQCKRQLHRICSNDIYRSLNIYVNGAQVEDFGDQSFCSRVCYRAFNQIGYMQQPSNEVNRELLWIDEEETNIVPEIQVDEEEVQAEEAQEGSTLFDSTTPPSPFQETLVTPPSNASDAWIMKQMVSFCPTKEDWMDKKTYKTVGSTTLIGRVTETKRTRKNDPTSILYLVRMLEVNI